MDNKLKIAFFSTSEFGDSILKYLLDNSEKDFDIKYVVSSYPKPRGRGMKVKDLDFVNTAKENNVEVIYCDNKKELSEKLKKWHDKNGKIDFGIVVDFAYIIEEHNFKYASNYFINIHPSILPKYRGASPIQYTLLNNDKVTGVTIQKMEKKVDTGDILVLKIIPVSDNEDYISLNEKLKLLSLDAIKEFFKKYNFIIPIKQDNDFALYSRKIKKEDGKIDFNKEKSLEICGKINAFARWPKVKIGFENDTLILLNSIYDVGLTDILDKKNSNKIAGEVVDISDVVINIYNFSEDNIVTLNNFNNKVKNDTNNISNTKNILNTNNTYKTKNVEDTNSYETIYSRTIDIETYKKIIKKDNKKFIFEFVKNNFKSKIVKKNAIIIKCKTGNIGILKLQKQGKKKLEVNEFLLGYKKIKIGSKFDSLKV